MDYEEKLFQIAPWTKDMLLTAKTLNEGSILRARTGWERDRGIINAESIYEHNIKVALAAFYLFGTHEAIALGAVHDLPEIYTPDSTPKDKVPKEVKFQREYAAMKRLSKELPNGKFWLETWLDFEEKKGIALQVNDLDKMCPAIQSIEYLKTYKNHNLEEFYPYARGKVVTPRLAGLLDSLCLREIEGNPYEQYFKGLERVSFN